MTDRRRLEAVLQVHFEGDYYLDDELHQVIEDWIGQGFCDRDNLSGFTMSSDVHALADDEPDFMVEHFSTQKWFVQHREDGEEWQQCSATYDTRGEAARRRDQLLARFPDARWRIATKIERTFAEEEKWWDTAPE